MSRSSHLGLSAVLLAAVALIAAVPAAGAEHDDHAAARAAGGAFGANVARRPAAALVAMIIAGRWLEDAGPWAALHLRSLDFTGATA